MNFRSVAGWLAASFISISAVFSASSAMAEQKTITDVIGRQVKVDLPAKRVVLGFYFEDYMGCRRRECL